MSRQPHKPDDNDLRQLLQEAGLRRDMPTSALAAIKRAAFVEWEIAITRHRRRRRRRIAWRLATAASVAVIALLLWARPAPVDAVPVATVDLAAWSGSEYAPGQPLFAGTVVGTDPGNLDDVLSVRLREGQSLRLRSGSSVELVSADAVKLERGALYFDSGDAEAGATIRILTPLGTVRDVGTQFEVNLAQDGHSLVVRVREGRISLSRDGTLLVASEREELRLKDDGTFLRSAIDPHASAWDWVIAAAPPAAIDGVALQSFLDWFARETGLRVEFDTPGLQHSAATTLLHGNIAGLDPLAALDTVLASAGMASESREGVLLVLEGSEASPTSE